MAAATWPATWLPVCLLVVQAAVVLGRAIDAAETRSGHGLDGAPAHSGSSYQTAKIGDEELGSKHSSGNKPSRAAETAVVSGPIDSGTASKEAQLLDSVPSGKESDNYQKKCAEDVVLTPNTERLLPIAALRAAFAALELYPRHPAIHEESVIGEVQDAALPADESRTDDPYEGDVPKHDDRGDPISHRLTPNRSFDTKKILCLSNTNTCLFFGVLVITACIFFIYTLVELRNAIPLLRVVYRILTASASPKLFHRPPREAYAYATEP